MASPDRHVHVRDAGGMRALSHPTRLRLLGELRADGPRSVGGLSRVVDEAPGSVSYHLAVLAEHDFVEEAPELAPNRRERWYRARHDYTRLEPADVRDDSEATAALRELRTTIADRYAEAFNDYLAREVQLPQEWVDAATGGDELLHLTVEQMTELREELHALARRWAIVSDRGAPGAEGVHLFYRSFRR